MPSKTRWALNPKKWFGHKLNTTQKRTIPPPTAKTVPTIIPRILSGKNKIKVEPISNDLDKSQKMNVPQFRLPAFGVRRERTLSTFLRQNNFQFQHTEPTIRKNSRLEEELVIDTTKWNIPTIQTKIYEDYDENSVIKQTETNVSNMSHRCLIDYPRESLPSRSVSSLSSINDDDDDDDNDNSSSSGIFTDGEHQRTESKDTLSTLEVLSVESIADSQTSLNHSHSRPIIHHYRRPMSVFQTTEDKTQQRQTSLIRSHRSHSAEGILKDNQTISTGKSRQSSAAIIKKIEKRFPISRSPSATLEKAGFIRITNDTYRLTTNKINHFASQSRKNSIDSFAPYTNYDDVLRSAKDEEGYATLPRTSSTEQLNNNIQNDLRIIVDECIRPMITSIGKNRSIKPTRYRRSNVNTQLNIENITGKLLSSVDYSIYTRYQRCNKFVFNFSKQ